MEALTLQDVRMTLDPNGLVGKVVDVMSTSGHLTEDGIWVKTNAFGKNVTPYTTEEPEGEFRRPNRGVAPGKGGIGQTEDFVGYIEAMSIVDDKTIRSVGKGQKQAVRQSYDALFSRGLAKQGRTYTIDGDRSSNAEEYNGMWKKREDIGTYCLDAEHSSPSGGRTSLYIVNWHSEMGCSYLFPEESQVGIQVEDFGRQVITDPDNSGRYLPAWISWFYYDLGFMVKDDRALIRIANIDTDPDNWSEAYMKSIMGLINMGLRLSNSTPDQNTMRAYGNIDALTLFDNMRHTLSNFNLNEVTLEGKTFIEAYHGLPLRRCDEITSAEAQAT